MPAGAISVHPYAHEQLADGDSLDDYDSEPLTSIADPLEPWNRFWFAFNDIFFLHVAKPVYNFYETVVPQPIRGGVKNFYANILMPKRMINSLLQFRVKEAFVEFGRFCMNTTVGLGGFADSTSTKKLVDIDPGGEDFGQTLGRWGIGHGFYIVWPFLGPSSVRESIGFVGDCATDVFFFVHPWELATASELYLRFNALDDLLPTYESLSGIAVDPYIAVREAYIQYREGARQTLIRRHLDDIRGRAVSARKDSFPFQTRRAGALLGTGRPTQQLGTPAHEPGRYPHSGTAFRQFQHGRRHPARCPRRQPQPAPAGITCLVGESGCGKSLTARAILHLLPENAHISGRILFRGRDLRTMPLEEMRTAGPPYRHDLPGAHDLAQSGTEGRQQTRWEPCLHLGLSCSEARQEVIRLFSEVGIPAAESRYDDYPHQLSGGMRQRVMIAMAWPVSPIRCWRTSPPRPSTPPSRGRYSASSRNRAASAAWPCSSSPTTWAWWPVSPTTWASCTGASGGTRSHGRAVPQSSASVYARAHAPAPGRAAMGMQRLPAITGSVPSLDNMPEGCPFALRCDEALPRCFERPCGPLRERPQRCLLGGVGRHCF